MKQRRGKEGGDFEIYEELAYNRKNSLCAHTRTHIHKTTRPNSSLTTLQACISILEVIAHPEGGGGVELKTPRGQAFVSTQQSLTLAPRITD